MTTFRFAFIGATAAHITALQKKSGLSLERDMLNEAVSYYQIAMAEKAKGRIVAAFNHAAQSFTGLDAAPGAQARPTGLCILTIRDDTVTALESALHSKDIPTSFTNALYLYDQILDGRAAGAEICTCTPSGHYPTVIDMIRNPPGP